MALTFLLTVLLPLAPSTQQQQQQREIVATHWFKNAEQQRVPLTIHHTNTHLSRRSSPLSIISVAHTRNVWCGVVEKRHTHTHT